MGTDRYRVSARKEFWYRWVPKFISHQQSLLLKISLSWNQLYSLIIRTNFEILPKTSSRAEYSNRVSNRVVIPGGTRFESRQKWFQIWKRLIDITRNHLFPDLSNDSTSRFRNFSRSRTLNHFLLTEILWLFVSEWKRY